MARLNEIDHTDDIWIIHVRNLVHMDQYLLWQHHKLWKLSVDLKYLQSFWVNDTSLSKLLKYLKTTEIKLLAMKFFYFILLLLLYQCFWLQLQYSNFQHWQFSWHKPQTKKSDFKQMYIFMFRLLHFPKVH